MLHALCLWLAGITPSPAPGDRSSEPRPLSVCSAKELRGKLDAAQKAIRSIHVVYRALGQDARDSPPGMYIRREVVAKAPGWFLHHGAHGYDGLDWWDDLLQQKVCITCEEFYREFPLKRVYEEGSYSANAALPGTSQDELFFEYTGLWPFESRPAPRPFGRVHVLKEVALSEDYAYVRPHQEKVSERWCHVLEMRGVDHLWLDADRGACLVAREILDPKTGRQATRVSLGGHREAAPGIWLPSWIEAIQYDFRARTDAQSIRKVTESEVNILELSVNDVDDSIFEFHPSPGSISRSRDGNSPFTQTEPGGLEYLDYVVRWVERHHPSPDASGVPCVAYFGYLAGVPFVIVVVFLHRSLKRSR